jgi:hypothetical protein
MRPILYKRNFMVGRYRKAALLRRNYSRPGRGGGGPHGEETDAPPGEDVTAPTITSSASISLPEGDALSHTLTADESVTWTKTGGADEALFTLAGSNLSMTAKDFEIPEDSGSNNTYVVQVTATDAASNATDQTITVTVTDVAEFTASWIDFDGASYLSKTIGSGISDGPEGTLSFWIKFDAADGVGVQVMDVISQTVFVSRNTSNQLRIDLFADGGSQLVLATLPGFTAASGRRHVALAWNLVGGTPVFQAYVDGSVVSPSFSSGPTAGDVDYTRGFNASFIGANEFAQVFDGELAELYFNDDFLDLDTPANLAKFISGGQAVYMGDTAQLPTGSQAKIAFSGNATHWQAGDGRGSIQGWADTGTFTDA